MEAALTATEMREKLVNENKSFTFETVLSTRRNLDLLIKAKQQGYFIRCIYVLTASPQINILRVKARSESGGHSVPEEKNISRYSKGLNLLPELISICDICHIYDNKMEAFRIFKKRKTEYFFGKINFGIKHKLKN